MLSWAGSIPGKGQTPREPRDKKTRTTSPRSGRPSGRENEWQMPCGFGGSEEHQHYLRRCREDEVKPGPDPGAGSALTAGRAGSTSAPMRSGPLEGGLHPAETGSDCPPERVLELRGQVRHLGANRGLTHAGPVRAG